MYIENPPTTSEETKWAYEQMLRLLEEMQRQQELIDALQERLANSTS